MRAQAGRGGGSFMFHVSIKETNYNHTTTRPFGARTIDTKFSFLGVKDPKNMFRSL